MTSVQEYELLLDISSLLNADLNLKENLYKVLARLSDSMGMIRGMITILNPKRTEIRIEVAHGLSPEAIMKGRYNPGEGIIGRVIQTGRPIIVPKIGEEPLFLNRTLARRDRDISFICVPIRNRDQVVGSLSIDRPYDENYNLREGESLLSIIATMIAGQVVNLETLYAEQEKLRRENIRLHEKMARKYTHVNIVGRSPRMLKIFEDISRVARSNATVLVRGESGTGKELVANAIHYESDRAGGPFVKVNCAALPSNLLESELFGHEKGAFTGALNRKIGKFERANCGTIFIDEIGSLSLEAQAKLLRVLQEKIFERVGATETITADVRIIVATNKDLEKAVSDNEFREDLFYRINVFPIRLPPLRERPEDIILLAEYFLKKYQAEHGKEEIRLSAGAARLLLKYTWPGNVRELENCIERAVLLCDEAEIGPGHFPPSVQSAKDLAADSLDAMLGDLQKKRIIDALDRSSGNMAQASRILGIKMHKLLYRARKYGVNARDYRKKRDKQL